MITLKLATSLDGKIATAAGESRWITGPESRLQVHQLRSLHDAVLVGAGTALADDPELTVRLPDYGGPQPARVVLDSRQRLSPTSRLALTARDVPTYLVTNGPPARGLAEAGVRIIQIGGSEAGRPALPSVVAALAAVGLQRLFVEGGGEVAASFLRHDLVARLEWFRAPIVIGDEGRSGVGALALQTLSEAPRLRRMEIKVLGQDLWESYERI